MKKILKRYVVLPILLCLLALVFCGMVGVNFSKLSASINAKTFESFSTELLNLIDEYEVDYKELSFDLDEELTTVNDTLMVNSEIFESVTGVSIFKKDKNCYTISNDETTISLNLNDNVLSVNDDIYIVKQPAEEISGEIYFPIEDVSKALGYDLAFDENELYLSRPYATKRIIVKSSENLQSDGAIATVEGYNNLHIYQYSTEKATMDACEQFDNLSNIDWYQVDSIFTPQNIKEETTIFGLEDSYSYTSWGAESMGIESYSNYLINTIGKDNLNDVVIAVLDTGIDTDHSWFTNRIASGGKNFSSSTSATAYEYEDGYGHGTHVSGIICDLTLDNVKILPIKVLSDSGYGYASQIILGINYVIELKQGGMNICAMNLSLGNSSAYIGSEEYNMYNDALSNAYNEGILSVVAAGNDGADASGTAPANVAIAITVGAVGKSGSYYYHPYWSNYGSFIDVSAPGYSIVSAALGGGTVSMSGTSMATPHVAAAVALLMSDSKNNYTFSEIENLLDVNAIDLGDDGWDDFFGEGMVNLEYAYAELIPDVTFSHTETDCTDPFELTLSTEITNASIYYTTDATNPTPNNGTKYTTPILIDKTQRIKARVYVIDDGKVVKHSKVSQMSYCFYGQDVEDAFIVSDDGVLVSYNGVLTDVTIPKEVNGITVVSIGSNAFTSSSVVSVTLPSTVTKIGTSAFASCTTLQTIYAPAVSVVEMYAFYGCSELQYVTDEYFPSLTSIGKYAFYKCYNLRPISLSNVQLVDYMAFYMQGVTAQYLTSVTLLSATTIAELAFFNCKYLTEINIPNVEIIASDAFRECNLINVDLPATKYLGNRAFYVNENLTTINMPEVLVIGSSCFYYFCTQLTTVYMPKVKYIGSAAFRDCSSLTSLDMPEVEEIYDSAFWDCEELESINVPKLKYVYTYAFADCSSLLEVELPSIISIGRYAFRWDSNLIKVTLSSCLENINSNSFQVSSSCVFYYYSGTCADEYLALQSYTKVDLATTNNSIFTYETYNGEVYITGFTGTLTEDITIPSYIDGLPVTKILENAFENCLFIKSLSISYLTEIEANAFKGCSNLTSIYLTRIEVISDCAFENCISLYQVDIENANYIKEKAFYGCSSLLSIKLGETIEYIGDNAFGYSANGELISNFVIYGYNDTVAKTYAENKNITFRAVFNNLSHFYYNTYSNQDTGQTEIYISFVDSYITGNIILPSSYNGMAITKIGYEAFKNCSLITGVILPSSIKTIDKLAFYGCSQLESINLDYVETIGSYAFWYCNSLKYVYAPLLTEISENTFRSCDSLSQVDIPNVTSIGTSAFGSCYSLSQVDIPNVTSIGTSAFSSCYVLKTINCPKLESIGADAFAYDYDLEYFDTLNITTLLGSGVFMYCKSLKALYLPKIITIGNYIFQTSAITKIVIGKNFTSYDSGVDDSSITVYGYAGTLAETYASVNSNTFVAIDEFEITTDLEDSLTTEVSSSCNLSVVATGFELKYQWYTTLANSTTDGTELYGETSSTLNVDTSSAGINKYFVKITNWDGEEITSNICRVTTTTYEEGTYVISASSNSYGSISPNESIVLNEGENQTFTFQANTGYHVYAIYIDDVALTETDLENAILNGYTFSNINAHHTIYVEFAIDTFTITVIQASNGSISPSGVIIANYGDEVTFTIAPEDRYEILKLIVDETDIYTEDLTSYTFRNITENHTISAEFIAIVYIDYIVNHYQETLDTNGILFNGKYYNLYETETFSGAVNTLTTATAKNYVGFTSLSFDNILISATEDMIVDIYYTRNSYTLTLNSTTGIYNMVGDGTYLYGQEVSISAELLEGYYFIAWRSSNAQIENIDSLNSTFTMPNKSFTLTATASIIQYTLTITQSENGTISATNTIVNYNGNATITLTADLHYHVESLIIDDINVGAIDTYTFIGIKDNHTITATFVKNTYTITLDNGSNGEVYYNNSITDIDEGEDRTFIISPDEDYELDYVMLNDYKIIVEDNTFTITNIYADMVIKIVYKQIEIIERYVTMTAQSGSNGSISLSGEILAVRGTDVTYNFTPNAGYHVSRILVDGVQVANSDSYTFISVNEDHTISVEFEENYYVINITCDANGSIFYNDSISRITEGSSRTFTLVPNQGYVVDRVTASGIEVKVEDNLFVINNIASDLDINVTFKETEDEDISPDESTNNDNIFKIVGIGSIAINVILFISLIFIVIKKRKL